MVLLLDGRGPRYAQITRALVIQIRRGVLSPGSRAPSTRELAHELGCSRNVVLLAYEQLLLEGYFVSRPRVGTFVGPDLPHQPLASGHVTLASSIAPQTDALSRRGRRLVEAAADPMRPIRHAPACRVDFIYGLCEPDDRLLRAMRQALSHPLRERAFSYGVPAGDMVLRQQIATRLRAARGIACSADRIVITSGTQQALDICARLLVSEGDRVAVEDPGYDVAAGAFAAAGARVQRARVDRDGLDPSCLGTARGQARLVYVTPSHQFPTGAVMPAARRYALLAWARRARACVFEDDYDGEFRYVGQPIPALAALGAEHVIYCGTFAKSLFPSCRLGYLVLPPRLVEPVVQCKWLSDRGSPRLIECALGELLASGHYDRHIRRMQRRYGERREVLVRSLRRHLGPAVEVAGSSAGLHLVAWLPKLTPDRVDDVVRACVERGVGVYPLSRHAARPPDRAGLMLGYGMVEVDDIDQGVRGIADAYREVQQRRGPAVARRAR